MKTANTYGNLAGKKAILAVLLLWTLSATPALAADSSNTAPVRITYIGTNYAHPVFQIDFDNPTAEKVLLTLSDENGTTIYSEWVKEETYSRKIQLENADFDRLKLKLTLRSKGNVATYQYQVNKTIRFVEDVEIAKL